MIGTQLHDGLGNQMFEYAASRVIAERQQAAFVAHDQKIPLGSWLDALVKGRVAAQIGDIFPNATQSRIGVALQILKQVIPSRIYLRLDRLLFPRRFRHKYQDWGDGLHMEEFDPSVAEIRNGAWIWGYFQSEQYFSAIRSEVLDWFRPSQDEEAKIDALIKTMPAPPERMVAIHVRRGDYLTQRGPISHSTLGWALPMSYYDQALAELPGDLGYAVFSDDPEFARTHFSSLNPWTPPAGSAATEMFLMGRCKYMVIANSTLSWWAAWLNALPDKVVLAPMYNIGWHARKWCPEGIDVSEWRYISPESTLERAESGCS